MNALWNMFSSDCGAEESSDSELVELQRSKTDATGKSNKRGTKEEDEIDDDEIFNFGLDETSADMLLENRSRASNNSFALPVKKKKESIKGIGPAIDYESVVIHICPACGCEFDTHDTWKRHINQVHNFNTRRGLNFVQVDKLYHICLECNKRIAMHAMENLMKHKFTHLPFRCSKCRICSREYKYKQDLIVHLRMRHHEDLASGMVSLPSPTPPMASTSHIGHHLEIKDVKAHAVDIFEGTSDPIEVKNEVEADDDQDDYPGEAVESNMDSNIAPKSLLEEALCRESKKPTVGATELNDLKKAEDERCEKFIIYICAHCGGEHGSETEWLHHIESAHDYCTASGLNFKPLNEYDMQCLTCKTILKMSSLKGMQYHKFTHLPHKFAVRCKLCLRSYIGRKEILRHLRGQHNLGDDCSDSVEKNADDDGDQSLTDNQTRDPYDAHISFLCPECGKEFLERKLWRRHIVIVHHLTDVEVLNFKIINDQQLMCRECGKIITNAYGIQNAQQHRITHMPYKSFIRCRLCEKLYSDRKGAVKHLRSVHRIFEERPPWSTLLPGSLPKPTTRTYSKSHQVETVAAQQRRTRPTKEVVRHEDYTYVIKFLDDSDDADNASIASDDDSSKSLLNETNSGFDDTTVPELMFDDPPEQPASLQNSTTRIPSRETNGGSATARTFKSSDTFHATPSAAMAKKPTHSTNTYSPKPPSIGDVLAINYCFLCPACGVEFMTQFEWRMHINEMHQFSKRSALNFRPVDKYHYQCMQCHDVVASSKLKALQDHKFRHLPHKLYIRCLLCSATYNHKPNMVNHLRVRHDIIDTSTQATEAPPPPPLPPVPMPPIQQQQPTSEKRPTADNRQICPRPPMVRLPGNDVVDDHSSFYHALDHESITYFCPQCNENFDKHAAWRRHIVDSHNLSKRQGLNFRQLDDHHFMCLQCYKRVTVTHSKGATGQLQSHKFRHLPYKSFKCLACGREFVRKQMFFKHLNRRTKRCRVYDANPRKVPISVLKLPITERLPLPSSSSSSSNLRSRPEWNSQDHFCLFCPQCNKVFDSWVPWREHINIVHELGKRERLHYKKIHSALHQCLDCGEHVSGTKLRDLQIHHFKHLPYPSYIRCRFCEAAYNRIRAMKQHLHQKHPDALRKPFNEYTKANSTQTMWTEPPSSDDDDEVDMIVNGVDEESNAANNDEVDEVHEIVSDGDDEQLVQVYIDNESTNENAQSDGDEDVTICEQPEPEIHYLSD